MATILVVDDEFGVAEVIEAILEDDGHTILCAVNGRQGLERMAERKPDLVILDFMMPLMDGPTMLRAIKADPTVSGVPVVMMSSLDEATIRAECEGYVAFLRKPFRAAQISETVANALGDAASA